MLQYSKKELISRVSKVKTFLRGIRRGGFLPSFSEFPNLKTYDHYIH